MPAENIPRQGLLILAKASNLSLGVPPETLAVNKRNKTRLQGGLALYTRTRSAQAVAKFPRFRSAEAKLRAPPLLRVITPAAGPKRT